MKEAQLAHDHRVLGCLRFGRTHTEASPRASQMVDPDRRFGFAPQGCAPYTQELSPVDDVNMLS